MKLVIEIPKEDYELRKRIASRHGAMNMVNTAIANGKPFDTVLDEIKAKIEPQRHFYSVSMDYCDAVGEKALDWVIGIIDKYKEGE